MEITIKTKFNIGQEVYWMNNNLICKGVIDVIRIDSFIVCQYDGCGQERRISYEVSSGTKTMAEENLFSSQGEILAALITKSGL